MRHELTHEEKVKGGKAGFRAAVFSLQTKHNLEFNDAVCAMKRKIGWMSPEQIREHRAQGSGAI